MFKNKKTMHDNVEVEWIQINKKLIFNLKCNMTI